MLAAPAPTPFDLNFRLLGVPVRVSLWFWVATAFLGIGPNTPFDQVLLWVACVFGSILIHEFGHALTTRFFGYRPRVVLYGMGGLCISDSERERPNERLAILLMGPGAQFLLLGVIFLVAYFAMGVSWRGDLLLIQGQASHLTGFPVEFGLKDQLFRGFQELTGADRKFGGYGFVVLHQLVYINLLWALVNLLPIYPLDGGQVAQILLTRADRVHGPRRTHIVSMITAGVIAVYSLSRLNGADPTASLFPVIFFGIFALMNYQLLQAHHQHYMQYGPEDADWWKR